MLSFRQYQQLNENFGPLTLGLGQVRSVGIVGATGMPLEEGKKKSKSCKKKMDVDDDVPEEEDDDLEKKGGVKVVGKGKPKDDNDDGDDKEPDNDADDEGGDDEEPDNDADDEGGDDEEDKDDGKTIFFQKKKSKKMQAEGLLGKKLGKGPPPDMGGDDLGNSGGLGDGDDLEGGPGDDDSEGDDLGDDDLGDEGPGEDEMGDLKGKRLGKRLGKKPPMDGPGPDGDAPMFMKRHSRKGMTKEQQEWWDSVEGQMNVDPAPKFFDGFTEIKSVEQAVRAGDIGFAPQGKIGSWF